MSPSINATVVSLENCCVLHSKVFPLLEIDTSNDAPQLTSARINGLVIIERCASPFSSVLSTGYDRQYIKHKTPLIDLRRDHSYRGERMKGFLHHRIISSCRLVGSVAAKRYHGSSAAESITVRFKVKDGSIVEARGKVGETNLLRLAQRYDVELEGACEGVCACSTCHIFLEDDMYDSLPEASELEEDMLDQAFDLKPTSRLACQLVLDKSMDNMLAILPRATRNFYVVRNELLPYSSKATI